ncbi:MAG TPA: alpha-ribazole transporter [Firmicutes bacterium]|jgi:hypothetical protein|nr:alpha-ribazole transporter [Bacillota bacterium]
MKPEIEKDEIKATFWHPRRVARIAIFIALAGVGALIKIPSPIGTIGLDSAPGYFSALAFQPVTEGSIVAAIGHLLSAGVVGFPLGIPLHLFIAVQMAAYAAIYGWSARKIGIIPAIIIASLLNGILASFTVLPVGGMGLVMSLIVPLTITSAVNIVIAAIAHKIVGAGLGGK